MRQLFRIKTIAFSHREKAVVFYFCLIFTLVDSSHSAVPFFGTKKRLISACSSSNSLTFLSIPPAYPVRLPLVPTTLWHGMIIDISLCPTAPPTAYADIFSSPIFFASRFEISPYVAVAPYGICKRISHTSLRKAEPIGCNGGIKSGSLPVK